MSKTDRINGKVKIWVVTIGENFEGLTSFKLFKDKENARKEFDLVFQRENGFNLSEDKFYIQAKLGTRNFIEMYEQAVQDWEQ